MCKCIYNPVLFPDKRGRWHQSVFHQVLAEIPLVSFCKVFTNKRDLLFFIHFILRGVPRSCFPSKFFLSGAVYNVQILILCYSHCLDILLACNISSMSYFHHCIAGALSMFPARGCVPNILPRECTGNTLPREVFLCTLPGAQ